MVRWPRKYSSRDRRDTEGELNKRAGNIEAGSKLEGVRQSESDPSTGGVTLTVSRCLLLQHLGRTRSGQMEGGLGMPMAQALGGSRGRRWQRKIKTCQTTSWSA